MRTLVTDDDGTMLVVCELSRADVVTLKESKPVDQVLSNGDLLRLFLFTKQVQQHDKVSLALETGRNAHVICVPNQSFVNVCENPMYWAFQAQPQKGSPIFVFFVEGKTRIDYVQKAYMEMKAQDV